jgi:segregation and condensation protein B
MTDSERKAALEAIIYAADEPATIEQLAAALGEDKLPFRSALDELIASYASDDRGIEVRAVAGGYKMYTKPQHHDVVRRFIKSLRPPLRLSMPALETLAVIAYKQPVTAPEISEIRGVNTSGVISTLLDKKLITTAGRKEVIGRPILYKTSKEFLIRFGLSDLDELPSLKEFEALAREALGSDEVVPADISEDQVRDVASADSGAGTPPGEQAPSDSPPTEPVSSDLPASSNTQVSNAGDASATSAHGSQEQTAISETIRRVEQELTDAEQFREHEAAATSEGMPSGALDEDPPPPSAKSTTAG